ncbi:BgTH12-05887 [Blumeria graminis f. sp. triticale]|uniref:BgTH12-05887 n=1 Tax=Blumeria graminis f. sp. triticale TaxID=1689686 RepID=A0A9W4D921_BLUGR|nr:BgTH12-05887 [Blumeria graminis f. sp. triticale]
MERCESLWRNNLVRETSSRKDQQDDEIRARNILLAAVVAISWDLLAQKYAEV